MEQECWLNLAFMTTHSTGNTQNSLTKNSKNSKKISNEKILRVKTATILEVTFPR
jgi:hypothetical protein